MGVEAGSCCKGPKPRPWESFPIHQHPALLPDSTWTSSAVGVAPAVLSVLGSSVQTAFLPPKVQQHRWVNRLRVPLPVQDERKSRTKGIGVGGERRASGKALQSWAPFKLLGPWPNPFEERPFGAKVSGNGTWGSRRPEFRVHSHHQL